MKWWSIKQKEIKVRRYHQLLAFSLLILPMTLLAACNTASQDSVPQEPEWTLETKAPASIENSSSIDTNFSAETSSSGLSTQAAGDLDVSFSGDGLLDSSIQAGDDRALGMAVQNDGKIVLAGPTGLGNFGVARYTSTGVFDSSFDADGIKVVDMGSSTDKATDMTLQSDGKIVVVGEVQGYWSQDAAVLRLNSNGSLDTSFSSDGKGYYDFNHFKDDHATAVTMQGSKIVVVGWVKQSSSSTLNNFVVMRLNANGSPDLSFNGSGVAYVNFPGYSAQATEVIVSNNKIIVVGYVSAGNSTEFAVARLNNNGSLDTSFSGDGKTNFHFRDYFYCDDGLENEAFGVAVDPGFFFTYNGLGVDRKIVVTGRTNACGDSDFAVARLNSNGSLDTSFSGDGKRILGNPKDEVARAVVTTGGMFLYPYGSSSPKKIVLAGYSEGGPNGADFKLIRLNWDGSNDSNFSWSSIVDTDFNGKDDRIYGAAIHSNTIIAAGEAQNASTNQAEFAVARYQW